VPRLSGGSGQQEMIMGKFFKRVIKAYIETVGSYRHPMMWPL
jgi:hypothetical protein